MSRLRELYARVIRKICRPIVSEIEQCKVESNRIRAEKKSLEERVLNLENNIRQNNSRLNGLESNIRQNNSRLNGLESNIRQNNSRLNGLEKNIRQNNSRLNALENNIRQNNLRLNGLEENIRQNNSRLNTLEHMVIDTRLVKLEDNIRQNNLRLNELEKANSNLEMNLIKVKSSIKHGEGSHRQENGENEASDNSVCNVEHIDVKDRSEYSKIDYFDFENHFRGSYQNVKNRQKMYLPYFKDCRKVLDIGCGRGEFLELLKENGIAASGIDIYDEYAEYCKMKELDVICGDGIEYLKECGKLDGIMAAQVVEHLGTDQIVTLCQNAYERLEEGGVLIIETPNPKVLAIYTNEFYMDPSHIKPVHPELLKYLAQKTGFREVEIVYTECSRVPKSIPALELEIEGNVEEFNEGMKEVSELLYGSRDYAIIARK